LNTYLAISLLFDVVLTRTLWLLDGTEIIAILITVATSMKLVVLLLEAHGKASYLRVPFSFSPPEAVSGIFSQSLFWWLNPLLKSGFGSILEIGNLDVLDHQLSPELLHGNLWKKWTSNEHTHRHALLLNVVAFLKWSWMLVVFPRACLIAFTYCQPFLINKVIGQVSDTAASRNQNNGYGLIAATFFIYAGIALSRVHYTHAQNRLITKIRGALVSIIYHKTLQLSLTGADTSVALTLMSTDTDRICFVLERINELWAGLIEFAIATFLLERQVGAACVAPAFVGLGE
jgi:ATP-binding cassette, subfamily C (CFTR/MRP), member 1